MRNAFTRRSSAIALAGVLALAGAACGDDAEDTGTDVNVTDPAVEEPAPDTTIDGGDTTVEETELDTGTETGLDTGTETETAG